MGDIQAAAQCVAGLPIWRAWRGHGSVLFFEMGKPSIVVREHVSTREVAGVSVSRRRAFTKGSHGIRIDMAQWTVWSGEDLIANSESDDSLFEEMLNWIEGQHLVGFTQHEPGRLTLTFDLGARFELSAYEQADPDDAIVVISNDNHYASFLADGRVVEEVEERGQNLH